MTHARTSLVRTVRGATAALMLCAAGLSMVSCSASSNDLPTPRPSPLAPKEGSAVFTISSPAFEAGGMIPAQYANRGYPGGENVSIPYEWGGVPERTVTFALLLVDRYPRANSWVHWLVTSLPPGNTLLTRGASGTDMPPGAREHVNSFGQVGYGGPQPPPGTGKHEYEAVLYALDTDTGLPERVSLNEFTRAIDGHVLATATYSGLLGR